MAKKLTLPLLLLVTALFWLANAWPASAQGVTYSTPTPGPDGRIIYKVQKGDTCLRIRLLTGISTDELIKLNNLNKDCVIQEGQELLLGRVEPPAATATAPAGPAPTAANPTATPLPGYGQVCIFLYDDVNGDSVRQESETAIAGGAASLTNRTGDVSLTQTTSAGDQAACFDHIPEGDYNISIAIPDGYNPTTALNYALHLQAGDLSTLDFGAQHNSATAPVEQAATGRSPMLGIAGVILLLGGAGLGAYLKWGQRPPAG